MKERAENRWENGTLWRTASKQSAAQNPIVLTDRPEDAQITHLDGPLTFGLKWGERQRLQPWPKKTVFDVHIGTPSLAARNCRQQMFSPLTVDEVPLRVHPVAIFEFTAKSGGERPIVREIPLQERCCGDTFYASFVIPKECGEGKASVSVTCPAWSEREVQPAKFEIPIDKERSEHSEQALVMFHDGQVGLEEATTALRKRGLSVNRLPDRLTVDLEDEPGFSINIVRGKEVQETAAAIGAGTKYASVLGRCDARFEISFRDLNRALEEKNTLGKIKSALKQLTHGVIYSTWDKQLSGGESFAQKTQARWCRASETRPLVLVALPCRVESDSCPDAFHRGTATLWFEAISALGADRAGLAGLQLPLEEDVDFPAQLAEGDRLDQNPRRAGLFEL